MASAYKIKIAARLRPPIPGELVDEGVQVEHRDDGTSCISVPNPRDTTQVFKFPYAPRSFVQRNAAHNASVLPLAMIHHPYKKTYSRTMYVL